MRWSALALLGILARAAAWAESAQLEQTGTPIEKSSPVKQNVPQGILDPILKEAAALAKVSHEQLMIVRAQSVIWGDGSLGCPEPGMMYTQMLVNGYWIVIEAAGKQYDFRVGSGGSFILCPSGRGHPPLQGAEVER
jgi:hypothetical protein